MTSSYCLNLEKIARLSRREALDALDQVRLDVTSDVGAARARIVGAEVEEQSAIGGWWGAQRDAARALGMTPARVGQLWKEYRRLQLDVRIPPAAAWPKNSGLDEMISFLARTLSRAGEKDLSRLAEHRSPLNEDETRKALGVLKEWGDEIYSEYADAVKTLAEILVRIESERERLETIQEIREMGGEQWVSARPDRGHVALVAILNGRRPEDFLNDDESEVSVWDAARTCKSHGIRY